MNARATDTGGGVPQAWTIGLQLLGASAALAALVTFVGGAMLWIRFDRLHLAADQAVARLPNELLLVVGAHALLGPILVGLAVLLFLVLLAPLNPEGTVRRRFWLAMVVIGTAAIITVLALVWDFDFFPEQLVMGLFTAAGIGAILAVAVRADRVRYVAWVVFAVFAVCGAVLAVVRTSGDPRMEPVAVLLSGGERGLSGFFVGETSDRLFLAPLPGTGDPGDPFADAQIDRVVSVSREKVTRVALREPVGIDPDDPGRDQAQSLLADLQQSILEQRKPRAEVVTTVNPVVAFAPLVHLHSTEKWFPMSVQGFLENSWLAWSHDDGCADYLVALGNHAGNPKRQAKQIAGRFQAQRLGRQPAYAHHSADRRCRDRRAVSYQATDHTRPHDEKGRPAGLELDEGFYLDLRDSARVGHDKPEKEGPQTLLRDVPVYFETGPEPVAGQRGLRITYWLFYGLSQPPPARVTRPIVHEGDWERISVLLRRARGRGDRYIPLSVRYHFHDENRVVPWYAVKRVAAGGPEATTHPVVFSARGSHASYPRAGRYENEFRFAGRRRFVVHDDAIACPKCPQWQTWRLLIDARTEPWYGFGGAWGKVGGIGGTTGPLGPSPFKSRRRDTPPEKAVGKRAPVPRADRPVEDLVSGR